MEFFQAGRAFILLGDAAGPSHLFFVLTDPDPQTNKVVTVMVVTAKAHTDKTVLLQPGEHSFVRRESSVDYSTANLVSVGKLAGALAATKLRPYPDMSKALLKRVREGLLESSRTINDIAEYCADKWS